MNVKDKKSRVQKVTIQKKDGREKNEPTKESWVNSKIGLLVIGALLSGIIVPTFQYSQKFFEWKRANQYQIYQSDIKSRKLLLNKLIESMSYLAEINELFFDFSIEREKSSSLIRINIETISKIQAKRFKINTEINYLIAETGIDSLQPLYDKFLSLNQKNIIVIKTVITGNGNEKSRVKREKTDQVKELTKEINESFLLVRATIMNNIEDKINENSIFRIF